MEKKNLHGLNMEIFESLCFNILRFKNLHVLRHGGFVRQNCSCFWISVFQYTEIKKSPCIKHIHFWIFVFHYTEIQNIRVLKHGDSKTSVFYTRRFFLKRPITRWNRNRWWKHFRVWIRGLGTTNLWKKQTYKISCYCLFKQVEGVWILRKRDTGLS